jgi:phage I-like protein
VKSTPFIEKSVRAMGLPCLVANRSQEDGEGKAPFRIANDGWWQISSKGEHPGRFSDGPMIGERIVQVIDDAAIASIVATFNAERDAYAAEGKEFPGMLVDFDHFSHDASKSSKAGCWIFEMEARPDGVWARGKWTGEGMEAVTNGDFRFASAVLCGFAHLERDKFRPSKVERVALTNDPNDKGLNPITVPNRNNEQGKTTMNHKALLARLLGLPETADDAAMEASVGTFTTAHRDIPGVLATLTGVQNRLTATASELDTTKNRVTKLTEEVVDNDLKNYAGVIENADAIKTALLANRDGTIAILKGLKKPAEGKAPDKSALDRANRKPVFNRDANGGKNPGSIDKGNADESEKYALMVSGRVNDILKNRKCTRAEATIQAMRQIESEHNVTLA